MSAMTGVPEQGVAPKPRVASVPGGCPVYVPCSRSVIVPWHFNITTSMKLLKYMLRSLSIYDISCRKLSLTRLSESGLRYDVKFTPLTADNMLTFEHQTSAFDGGDYDAAGSCFAYEVGTKECLALIEIGAGPLYGLGFG